MEAEDLETAAAAKAEEAAMEAEDSETARAVEATAEATAPQATPVPRKPGTPKRRCGRQSPT